MRLFTTLLLLGGITVLGGTSCVRDYTCQCDIKYTGQPGLPDSLTKEYPIRDTKSKAKSLCEANSSSADANGIHTEEKCHLF